MTFDPRSCVGWAYSPTVSRDAGGSAGEYAHPTICLNPSRITGVPPVSLSVQAMARTSDFRLTEHGRDGRDTGVCTEAILDPRSRKRHPSNIKIHAKLI